MQTTEIEGKRCTGCDVWRPLTEFHRDRRERSGRRARCRVCTKAYAATPAGREAQRKGNRRRDVTARRDDVWARWARRRAREAGALVIEDVRRLDVFTRDGWVCQLCGEPVDRETGRSNPRAASVDHTVPLSEGGVHTLENVVTAHPRCNVWEKHRLALVEFWSRKWSAVSGQPIPLGLAIVWTLLDPTSVEVEDV